MFSWQLFLFASILLTSINGLFHRVVMKTENSNPIAQTVAFATLAGLFAFLISLYQGFHLPNFSLFLPNIIFMVILLTLAPLCTFRAYQLTEASEVGILLSSQRLWTVIASFIFLGETPTVFKIAGTVFILAGVSITSWKKHKIRFTQGEIFALIAALLYGLSFVNAFYILRSYDAPSFEVLCNILPVIVLLVCYPKVTKKMKFYLNVRNFMGVSFAALFDALAAICLYIAYQYGRNASQIAPLSATSLVITVIFASVFLKERKNLPQKIIGACVVIAGVIFLL
ncbi:MAG TPA: EamA family transporter [Candidatus Saccharimonadales bacterium]|nr:EamA family transporter [Candidatus Saccharimonadales bacterium]